MFPEPAIYGREIDEALIDSDAAKVLRRLSRHGYVAYLVGGGVRDLLLGRRPKDFDVATDASPSEVRRLFRNSRVIGRRFRLVHVLFAGGNVIEVATFRRDPAQRYAAVAPELVDGMELRSDGDPVRLVPLPSEVGGDLLIRNDNIFGEPHEDAIRRDFTINGLFYDLDHGEVIDYVGGMSDLERRVVRMIGEPEVRFREDPVRILRAIKFSARLDLGIDAPVYEAIVHHRCELARAASARVLEEIFRLLRGGAAHRSVYLCWESGVLAEVLPELACFLDDDGPQARRTWGRLLAADAMHRDGALPKDAVVFAAMLLGPILEAVEGRRDVSATFDEFFQPITERLNVPRRMKDRVRLLVLAYQRLSAGRAASVARREVFPDAMRLYALDCVARGDPAPDLPPETPDRPPRARGDRDRRHDRAAGRGSGERRRRRRR
ncbi:MAG: polynucleotide adenylyltransferase PcnB [Myxococcales bacterium]|nr:polynucleotide adenylyltransferase PcnB [Myxococcales bacterium]